MASARAGVAWPAGSSTVAMNQRGVAPMTAMSLALTLTAYQPISSRGEGDGVGLGHQVGRAEVDHGRVDAHLRADQQARVAGGEAVQEAVQQGVGQLAGREDVWCDRL